MNRRPLASLRFGALLAICAAIGARLLAATTPARPNIVFILMDDRGGLMRRSWAATSTRYSPRASGAIRAGDWKLIEYFEDDSLERFNLHDDIGERKNLVRARPEKAQELQAMLQTWRAKTGATVPRQRNPLYRP